MGSARLAAARPAEPWWLYPFSPKGWGVKTDNFTNVITMDMLYIVWKIVFNEYYEYGVGRNQFRNVA